MLFSLRERLVMAVACLVLLGGAVSLTLWHEIDQAEQELRTQSQRLAGRMSDAVGEGVALVSALYSFYHGNGEMSAERFPIIAEKFLDDHPQIGWLGYAARVDPAEVTDFEESMELAGFIDYRIHTSSRQVPEVGPDGYFLPLTLLEPLAPSVARHLGRDLLSDRHWRASIHNAIVDGKVSAVLTRGLTSDVRGYLLVRATYRGTVEPTTQASRQRQLAGVIMIYLEESKLLARAAGRAAKLNAAIVTQPPKVSATYDVHRVDDRWIPSLNLIVGSALYVLNDRHSLVTNHNPSLSWVTVGGALLGTLTVLAIGLCAIWWRRCSQRTEEESIAKAIVAEATLASVGDAVIRVGEEGQVLYANPRTRLFARRANGDLEGRALGEVLSLQDGYGHVLDWPELKAELKSGAQLSLVRDGGRKSVVSCTLSPFGFDDEASGYVLALRDVTVEYELTREIEHQAKHDALTGLRNRHYFEEQLHERMTAFADGSTDNGYCVLYLDLDQFKLVNDTCGHAAGDQLLCQLSGELAAMVEAPGILARLGGDEFGVLLSRTSPHSAVAFAQTLCDAVSGFRFTWGGRVFTLGVSIGVVHLTPSLGTAQDVLRAADLACYAAKDLGRSRLHVYRPDDSVIARNEGEMKWQEEVKLALADERFVLHGQPILPLSNERAGPAMCELLVRMFNPDGSLSTPMAFIPAAERYGLMSQIDREVIMLAFQYIAAAPRDGVVYSINLSGQSMADPNLETHVIRAAKACGLDPARVCLEVTETSAISNLAIARQLMQRLRDAGFRFALDDFGAGLSSLRYLKQLPVDYLKIDGQFVRGLENDAVAQTMVESIVRVAEVLEIETIGEMVESEASLELLRDLGVDYAQGFHLGKPYVLPALLAPAKIA